MKKHTVAVGNEVTVYRELNGYIGLYKGMRAILVRMVEDNWFGELHPDSMYRVQFRTTATRINTARDYVPDMKFANPLQIEEAIKNDKKNWKHVNWKLLKQLITEEVTAKL